MPSLRGLNVNLLHLVMSSRLKPAVFSQLVLNFVSWTISRSSAELDQETKSFVIQP